MTPQSSHVSVSGLSQLPPGQGRGGGGDPGGGGARREHEGKMRRDENTPAHFMSLNWAKTALPLPSLSGTECV